MTRSSNGHGCRLRAGPFILAVLLGPAPLEAHTLSVPDAAQEPTYAASIDSTAVAKVVHQFHAALEAGDSVAALALLIDDAVVLESGGLETRAEYRAHHLPGDIAFAGAVNRETGPVHVTVRGDVAWTTSTSLVRGTFRDREVNSRSVELMVLERTPDGWRIAAIHWSSRSLR